MTYDDPYAVDEDDASGDAYGAAAEADAQPSPQDAVSARPQPSPVYQQPNVSSAGDGFGPPPPAPPGPLTTSYLHQPGAPTVGYPQPGYGAGYPHPGVVQPYPPAFYGPLIYDDPNSPGAPLRGASAWEAYKRFWLKGFTFKGRASLSEFWWVQLAHSVVYMGLLASGLFLIDPIVSPGWALACYVLATAIPSLALGTRRLHDTNQSGWLQLLSLIPYVGPLVVFILMLGGGRPEGARYDY